MERLLQIAALSLFSVLAGCRPPTSEGPLPTDGLRDSGTARFVRDHPAFSWVSADTDHFRLYVEAGPDADVRLDQLGDAAEGALADVRAYLGRRFPLGRQSLFFLDTRDRMQPLVGRTPGGWAVPQDDVVLYAAPRGGAAPALRHELTHIEAWATFGERADAWTDEGLATAAVGRCLAYTIDDTAAALIREHRTVPLDTLAATFPGSDDVAAYLQAASVMAFARERWGLDAVAALWRAGLAGSERATGLDPAGLDAAWRAHVTEADRGVDVDWDAIRQHGCESDAGAV